LRGFRIELLSFPHLKLLGGPVSKPRVSKNNVLDAISRIRAEGVPPNRRATKYHLDHDGSQYPPKYVLSLAVEKATGRALAPNEFSGGVETNSVLRNLGFSVVAFDPTAADDDAGNRRVGDHVYSLAIARVAVRGDPTEGDPEALLVEALTDEDKWPRERSVKFLLTPGGFVCGEFPRHWSGHVGWDSSVTDVAKLIDHARPVLKRALTPRVRRAALGKVEVLTIGIDLSSDDEGPHAELVAVCDLKKRLVAWTGKSYPVASQERSLVQVTDLRTHLVTVADERVLVLGCHDLNMFSERGWSNQSIIGVRRHRCNEMRHLARAFRPTVVLQHPHSTDSPNIWRTAWAGLHRELPGVMAWASGIGYYRRDGARRGSLREVLAATAGHGHSIDVVLKVS
jgi:hypothetical protein